MNSYFPYIRLLDLTLEHFKNVAYGRVDMPHARTKTFFSPRADLVGIYGQNGSGKTAVVQALLCLGMLWRGESVESYATCIEKGETEATLSCTLALETAGSRLVVRYSATLRRVGETCRLYREALEYAPCKEKDGHSRAGRYSTLARFEEEQLPQRAGFSPTATFKEWSSRRADLKQGSLASKTLSYDSVCSYLFAPHAAALFRETLDGVAGGVYRALADYAHRCMTFIGMEQNGCISLNLLAIHVPEQIGHGSIPVTLNAPSVLPLAVYEPFRTWLCQLNTVLQHLIPGLALEIHELGQELYAPPKGQEMAELCQPAMRFELESVRGKVRIPLKSESDGIKRILCLLGPLVDMYNKPGTLLVVDELDSGIYEYLLGELLAVLSENGKGQLIFTSHNLRPLEMLNREQLLFSTTNPKERYIRFAGVRPNNNLRDLYIRAININDQKEEVYTRTDPSRINRAFRSAGKEFR